MPRIPCHLLQRLPDPATLSGRCRTNHRGYHHSIIPKNRKNGESKIISNGSSTIEDWFRHTQKPDSFYQEYAAATANTSDRRCYFYTIDWIGRLFLEDTWPKTIATSIKDPKFLNQFWRRMRPRETLPPEISVDFPDAEDYPFVNVCGRELNFVRPVATPVVFHTLNDGAEFLYAANASHPFLPEHLRISEITGWLYHTIDDEKLARQFGPVALVRSSVAVILAERLEPGDDDGWVYRDDSGRNVSVPWLPAIQEPGPWAMPPDWISDSGC